MPNKNVSQRYRSEADDLHDDDRPVGRILNRREVLALFGAAGVTLLMGCGPASSGAEAPAANAAATATLNPEAAIAVATATAAPGLNPEAGVTALPQCIVSPEQVEGPYYAVVDLQRSDIRTEPSNGLVKEGMPLALTLGISQVSANGAARHQRDPHQAADLA